MSDWPPAAHPTSRWSGPSNSRPCWPTASRALKPRDGGDFGTSEQWRHYNSLYFPYVVGVRAYAQNATAAGLDPTARQAWQWFVTEVPQRSLHNWQNAAPEADRRRSARPGVGLQLAAHRLVSPARHGIRGLDHSVDLRMAVLGSAWRRSGSPRTAGSEVFDPISQGVPT